MKVRNAVLTGLTGLMLNMGVVGVASAQTPYRYRNNNSAGRAYAYGGGQRQAMQVVRQAYRDILRREPDASGLREYTDAIVNRGWSETDLRRSLMNSDEYAQRFGGRNSNERYGSAGQGWRRNR